MAPLRLLPLLLYSLIFLAASVWLTGQFSRLVPSPYMDEVFHVPQTQAYCDGRWSEWHPKITTLPGLYVSAVPFAHAVRTATVAATGNTTAATNAQQLCSVSVLRSINVVYGVLCIPLYYALLRTLHPAARSLVTLLSTLQLSLFPLSFFFIFLYYTDLASVFWTLAAYLAHLRGQRFAGALLGVAAVAVRQTNVAWVGFILLTEILHAWRNGDAALFGKVHAEHVAASSKLRQRLIGAQFQEHAHASTADREKDSKIALESVHRYHTLSWSDVPRSVAFLLRDCVLSLPALVLRQWGALLTCAAFVAFVVANGGSIVVGDRDNHVFSPHWPQLLYFIAFAAGMTLVNWLSLQQLRAALNGMGQNRALTLVILAGMAIAVHFFTSVNKHTK